jgi:tRNA pseudouridine13 synthase
MSAVGDLDLELPYITPKLLGIGGKVRARPDLFVVEEIPAYEPLGYGGHLYVNLTKELTTTRETQLRIAGLLGLRPEDVGHAGLKDKYARTTQTFSILLEDQKPDIKAITDLMESSLGVEVKWARLHPRKLRSGHLRGNRFVVTVTDLDIPTDEAAKRAGLITEAIHGTGAPNYYGSQRIGARGNNVYMGLGILSGERREPNRWLRRYLISSYLSYLCNRYIAERVRRNLFTRMLRGDVAKKHGTGGVFWVEDPATEQTRCDEKEISWTVPIFGSKMRAAKAEAALLEEEIFVESGLTMDQLRRHAVEGTRRIGRLIPEVEVSPHQEGLTLSFDLPAGGFATTILREFMKDDVEDAERNEEDT